MAIFKDDLKIGHMVAGADLSAELNKFVKVSADDTVVLVAAATDLVAGVNERNDGGNGKAITINRGVMLKVVAGGTVNAGDEVASANGTAIAASSGNVVHGICSKGGAAGELIEVIAELNAYVKA